ncbi:MAG: methylaspartate ammonia-lyase, partial [Bacilli bacterium]|nr:methylaspartate ammonia-lyase [Bacilli bacterium]
GSKALLVADEWCNTFDDVVAFVNAKAGHIMQIKTPDLGSVHNVAKAVLYCNERGFGSYVGGTCNETDVSARCTTNVAMATEAFQVLAKPGMGVDEGYMIVNNEMNRVVALANRK